MERKELKIKVMNAIEEVENEMNTLDAYDPQGVYPSTVKKLNELMTKLDELYDILQNVVPHYIEY